MTGQQKRKRGVILTRTGLKKLQEAKSAAEFQENNGNRYTLEVMSERTGLAVDTLMKVFVCEMAVDKQTLKRCFEAFHLLLDLNDYFFPRVKINKINGLDAAAQSRSPWQQAESLPIAALELPGGPVPLESPFYQQRLAGEFHYHELLQQRGALLRIVAAAQMGKTSFLIRLLEAVKRHHYHIVFLNFQIIETSILSHFTTLIHFLSAYISKQLNVPNQILEYGDELLGAGINATEYLEHYLLAHCSRPLILALDGVEQLFPYADTAINFFGLLRSWHEKTKYSQADNNVWRQLRLVVTYSLEHEQAPQLTQALEHVGLFIHLPPFTAEHIQTLAQHHQLNLSPEEINHLLTVVGGAPHRIRIALYELCCAQQKIFLD